MVHLLEFFLVCPPEWHSWRYCWGGGFPNIFASYINASLCVFLSVTIEMSGVRFYNA